MTRHKLIIAFVVVAVSLGGWATLRNTDSPEQPASPGTAGFIAVTGDPDDPNAAKDLGGAAFNTSSEGLAEVPADAPGGGTMVDLQGRFRSAMSVTVTDSDSVTVHCSPDSAPGGGR